MKLHNLKPQAKSKKKRKRVGRGNASGFGTYSGKGMKGQKSRSGASFYPGFEGGRTPLIKQIPKKKGFKSFKIKPEVVNVEDLNKHFKDGAIVDKIKLNKLGLIESSKSAVKLLSNGELKKKLTVRVDKSSAIATKKVEKAGGKVVILNSPKQDVKNKKDKKSGKEKK